MAAANEEFTLTYARPRSEAELLVEREVFGARTGADGYTTVEEAAALIDPLGLRAGMSLLDLGSGRGWPGVYLAKQSGCNVVLTDVPVSAPRNALARARSQRLTGRSAAAVARGEAVPFRSLVFDAIVHADVFC